MSQVKNIAFEVLNCFDELAKPEIKNRVMAKIWSYVKSYAAKKILRKPDEEIKIKLFKIHQILGPYFNEVSMSIEMQKAESLGSIPVPDVGKMGEIKQITKIDEKKALELLKELKFV